MIVVLWAARSARPLPDAKIIAADAFGYTGVRGLYAAGDAVTPLQQVGMAVSDGASAAGAINRDLVREDIGVDSAASRRAERHRPARAS
jgi:alkyl hydroperoxide reductase subunit AhpF